MRAKWIETFGHPMPDSELRKFIREHTWPRPIPVSERLPPKESTVLFYEPAWGWRCGTYQADDTQAGFSCDHEGDMPLEYVTHWIPLPPFPDDAP